jgi:hypothetical protein
MNKLASPPAPAAELPVADEFFVMPASVGQKRFWMLEQMSPGNTALNIPIAFELRGPLDPVLLERALQAIVDRHESLRTRFELVEGEPRQVIAPHATLTLHRVADDSTLAGDRDERIRQAMDREARTPIDFARAPLMRATLLAVAPEEHVLMLTIHHIICDGWSTGTLVRELAAFYDAVRLDEPVQLPALPIQYADYVLWQEEWLKTPDFRKQMDFWRTQLGGETPVLDFPTDFLRRSGQSTVAVLETRLLPAGVTESLKRVCQEEGVTLFMIFISAYAALLHRYTGQPRILVGTTAANRGRPELEPIVGLFANLLSVPADISGTMTFRELLTAQRDRSLGGFANHEAPFELVVQELQQSGPARVPMHTHLLFQRAFMQPAAAGELQIRPLRSVSPGSTFELTFGIVERASEGIRLQMEYRTSLYRRETIARLLLHFQQLLEAIAERPETPIAELPLFADGKREAIEARMTGARLGHAPADRAVVLAQLERQLDDHFARSQETFAPVEAPSGTALAVLDAAGQPLPVDLPGEVHLALPGENAAEVTPFLGRNTEGGGVELWGRVDDVVLVQGFRFNRRRVEVQLCAHPDVAAAAVELAAHRLTAHVVLKPSAAITAGQLRDWLKDRTSDLLLPASIRLVAALARNAHGNLVAAASMDEALPAQKAEAPVPLQAVIQQQLLEIWQRLLKTSELTPESNFFECGGNSFLALRMMTEAEKLARQPLPLSLLLRGATVRELARHILEGAHQPGTEVIPVQPQGSQPPLFFLHGDWIGGGFYCNRLARDLGEDQPFFALPPYHLREQKVPSIQEMADHHLAALRGQRPHGPYLIGGYCIGATVAIEIARQLLAQGEEVVHLFLVDPPLLGGSGLRLAWPLVERWGDARGWSLEEKIAFFDRTAGMLGRWWRRPLAAKFAAVLRRAGVQVEPATGAPEVETDDLGAASVLDGLDYSAYYISYRLYRPAALSVPATLFFPEDTPVSKVSRAGGESRIDPARLGRATIRGSHTNCITEHTDSLAEKMRAASAS